MTSSPPPEMPKSVHDKCEDESISSGSSSHGEFQEHDPVNTAALQEEREMLERNEHKAVVVLRVVVFLVLLVTMALVSSGVYYYIKQDQRDDFERRCIGQTAACHQN